VDVLTVIAAAPAFAGENATVVAQGVQDACRTDKELLVRKYSQVELTAVEVDPVLKGQQMELVKQLTSSGAAADLEFSPLARQLVDAVAAEVRKVSPRRGACLDFEAVSLCIDNVIRFGTGSGSAHVL
jgi:hypothetical protein